MFKLKEYENCHDLHYYFIIPNVRNLSLLILTDEQLYYAKTVSLHPLLMISNVTFSGLGHIVEALDHFVVARKD